MINPDLIKPNYRETDTHIYFWGSWLSNFFWAPFKFSILPDSTGAVWYTSEHCFMALKALEFNDLESLYKIHNSSDAKTAKEFGRKVKNFDEKQWDKVKYNKMLTSCDRKFHYEENFLLKEALFNTKDKILVEASPYDKIWGVGLSEHDDKILDQKNWKGQNLLGKVLMQVREELR